MCPPTPISLRSTISLADLTRDYYYPVAYDIPVGHVTHNIPLVCGAACSLSVGESSVEISQ